MKRLFRIREEIPRSVYAGVALFSLLLIVVIWSALSYGGIVDSLFEATELLVFAYVQVEFEDMGTVVDKVFFEIVDEVVALRPYLFRDEVMHPADQHIFKVGAVEDRDPATLRCSLVIAPEEIVGRLLG